MKSAFLAAVLFIAATVASATAGSRIFINVGGGYGYGGCAPRYCAPVHYCAPRAVYCRPAPFYYVASPVVYAACAPVYRAPIVGVSVNVAPVAFGWRR